MSQANASQSHQQLLERIHRLRYETFETEWTFNGVRVPFIRIADPDRVLDRVAEEQDQIEKTKGVRTPGDQLHLPYWAELWDSAAGIGQHLARRRLVDHKLADHRNDYAGLSVLDLGCGMGMAGTIAARLGMRVLFADLEPPALLFARLNSLPDAQRVRFRQLNWQTDELDERFDLIIGADILYERKQWDFLEPFWRNHLAPGGQVLLGEPGRQTGDLFPEWIASCGWSLTRYAETVPTRSTPIRLFELRLSR